MQIYKRDERLFQVRMLRRNVAVHHRVFNAEIPSNNGTQSDLQSAFAKVSVTFQVLRYNLLKKFRIHPNH